MEPEDKVGFTLAAFFMALLFIVATEFAAVEWHADTLKFLQEHSSCTG